jgi:tetratricopeptide (TPR) repeat protein
MSKEDPSDNELLAAVEKHLQESPSDASAWNVKGVLLAKTKEFGAALRSLDTAIRLKPDMSEAHTNRGRVLLALGAEKAPEALRSFERALELSPGALDALHDKALALRLLGKAEEELTCITELTRRVTDEPALWARMGDLQTELGVFEDAVKSYDRSLAIDAVSVVALVHRAVALAMVERYKEAIQSAEAATKLAPENVGAWRVLADVNLRAEKHKSAMKALERAATLDPTDATIENTMGMVAYKSGDLQNAVTHFERAAMIDRRHRSALRNLGFIHMELEQWIEAERAWSRLTMLLKDDPEVWDAKAATHARLNDFCPAAEAWQNARRLYRSRGNEREAARVQNLGRAARINCSRQKEADRAQREHEKATRTFSDRFERRRKK